jgi:hypothetical protein
MSFCIFSGDRPHCKAIASDLQLVSAKRARHIVGIFVDNIAGTVMTEKVLCRRLQRYSLPIILRRRNLSNLLMMNFNFDVKAVLFVWLIGSCFENIWFTLLQRRTKAVFASWAYTGRDDGL